MAGKQIVIFLSLAPALPRLSSVPGQTEEGWRSDLAGLQTIAVWITEVQQPQLPKPSRNFCTFQGAKDFMKPFFHHVY